MSKRLFIITLVLSILVLSLSSCKKIVIDEFEDVNKVLNMEYSKIEVTICTSKDDLSLSSSYSIEKSENDTYILTYSIEKYNELSLEKENNESNKSVFTGNETIEKGKTSKFLNENLAITVNDSSLSKFVINKNTSSKYTYTDAMYSGDINYPKALFGINSNDCKMTIKYSKSAVESIVIEYTQDGFSNIITYIPTK